MSRKTTALLIIPTSARACDEGRAGRELEGPFVFHCTHRVYGVGMIDVSAVLAADAEISRRAERGPASFLVGTASHCHGALQRIEIGPPEPAHGGSAERGPG